MVKNPNRMAVAFKKAVEAGRDAYELGLGPTSAQAHATSPLTAFLNESQTAHHEQTVPQPR